VKCKMLLIVLSAVALATQYVCAQAQVVPVDPTTAVTADYALPADAPKLVRLVAPRGGFASGQVLVKTGGAITALPVQVGPLVGPGTIPATALQVRYPTRKPDLAGGAFDYGVEERFDALSDKLIPGEALQPVWLTVTVPETAAPGVYKSDLTINGKKLPLELTVGKFVVPKQRQLLTETLQSADSVALRYGVQPYSDAHFKLLEASLALQGRIGNNVLIIPVIGQAYIGNQIGLIQYRKTGGKLTPDFTTFDRYLALYHKYCGAPRMVTVYLWENHLSDKKNAPTREDIEVTVLGANGAMEAVTLPNYAAGKEAFKATLAGIVERVGKLGTKAENVMVGQSCDNHPTAANVAFFNDIAPGMKWAAFTHGYGYSGNMGMHGHEVKLFHSPDFTPGPDKERGGWNQLRLNSLRSWLENDTPPIRWRLTADLSCGNHKQGTCAGYGMIGLDYLALPPKTGSKHTLTLWAGPYPGLKYCRLDRGQVSAFSAAGPSGVISTVRLEMLAEGAFEAEARIAIEQAVSAKKLDATKAGELLLKRGRAIMAKQGGESWQKTVSADASWHDDLVAIYNLAGEAQP